MQSSGSGQTGLPTQSSAAQSEPVISNRDRTRCAFCSHPCHAPNSKGELIEFGSRAIRIHYINPRASETGSARQHNTELYHTDCGDRLVRYGISAYHQSLSPDQRRAIRLQGLSCPGESHIPHDGIAPAVKSRLPRIDWVVTGTISGTGPIFKADSRAVRHWENFHHDPKRDWGTTVQAYNAWRVQNGLPVSDISAEEPWGRGNSPYISLSQGPSNVWFAQDSLSAAAVSHMPVAQYPSMPSFQPYPGSQASPWSPALPQDPAMISSSPFHPPDAEFSASDRADHAFGAYSRDQYQYEPAGLVDGGIGNDHTAPPWAGEHGGFGGIGTSFTAEDAEAALAFQPNINSDD